MHETPTILTHMQQQIIFWGLFRLYWTELRDRKGGRERRGGGLA